ncbi:G8 domain-containing protein DDB_G0286311-like [Lutzomyia longipalpis]|uniref:G8 domain-containing protein DDB_G0286311-like n=1 Tax=Lutzomyia longipalpis TaxID=7200 RepID=UPI0024845F14|nr:G8 domain-containing protein DDB_G0286311-like [Lutzomyia longipalpis]
MISFSCGIRVESFKETVKMNTIKSIYIFYTFFIISFIQQAACLKCYNCNSYYDNDCSHLNVNTTAQRDCDLIVGQHIFYCFYGQATVEGQEITLRGCAENFLSCDNIADNINVISCHLCDIDLCNNANATDNSTTPSTPPTSSTSTTTTTTATPSTPTETPSTPTVSSTTPNSNQTVSESTSTTPSIPTTTESSSAKSLCLLSEIYALILFSILLIYTSI